MFRDRTNLFLSYRRTLPRNTQLANNRFQSLVEEEEGLIGHRKAGGTRGKKTREYHDEAEEPGLIELKPMAPSIFDISTELDQHLVIINKKTNELGILYKKLLITTYNEKSRLESQLEELNYEITKKFEACYVLIKKFEFLQKNHQRLNLQYNDNELSIIENFKKNYALKIQEKSLIFRNLQNNYIKFLRDEEDESDNLLSSRSNVLGSSSSASPPPAYDIIMHEEESKDIENYSRQIIQQTQQQISNSQMLETRERDISKIAMGILEISTIFKEMESLVIDQGTVLDRIDYNITNTSHDLFESGRELTKAQGYQKRTTKCKIIFLLSLIVAALVIVVLVKPHGTTKYITQPAETPKPDNSNSAGPSSDPGPDPNAAPKPADSNADANGAPERPALSTPDSEIIHGRNWFRS